MIWGYHHLRKHPFNLFFFVLVSCGPKAWHLSGQALAQNFWSHEAPKTAVALNTRAGGPTWRPRFWWNEMKIQLKNPGFIWIYHDLSRIYMDLSWFIHDLSMIYYVLLFWILLFLLDSVLMPDSLTVTWWIFFRRCSRSGAKHEPWARSCLTCLTGICSHRFYTFLISEHTWTLNQLAMKYDACCCCFGYRKAKERQWTEESWAIVGLLYPDTKPVVETSFQTMNNIARQRPSPPCNFQPFQGDWGRRTFNFAQRSTPRFTSRFAPISMESSPSARSVERGYPVVSVSRSISRIEHMASWQACVGCGTANGKDERCLPHPLTCSVCNIFVLLSCLCIFLIIYIYIYLLYLHAAVQSIVALGELLLAALYRKFSRG